MTTAIKPGEVELGPMAIEVSTVAHIAPAAPQTSRWGYVKNALLVGGLTLTSAVVNRFLGNSIALGSKANAEGGSLLANYLSSGFINHTVKGNIRHVDSQKKQFAAIAAFTAGSIAIDALVGVAFGGPILSATTAIALANTAAHLIKISCYKVVGKKPYLYGEETESADPETTTKRCALNLGVTFLSSLAAAAVGQFVPAGTSTGAIFYNLYSAAYRKLGKAALQVIENKKGRQAIVALHALAAISASVLSGTFKPFDSDADNTLGKVWAVAKQYFGPTTAIALTGYATDQVWRAKQKWKPSGVHAEPQFKPQKSAVHSGVFLGETALAATINSLNGAYFGASQPISLGSKLWQQGLTYHTLREALKGSSGWKKAEFIGAATLSSVVPQAIANAIGNDGTGSWPLTAMSVSLGNVAAFIGKDVRNRLLPKH